MSRRTLALARQQQPRAAELPRAGAGRPAETAGSMWSSMALKIEPSDSPLERQADAVANRVVQRKCAECEDEDATLRAMRSADVESDGGIADSSASAVRDVVGSASGTPLDQGTRAYFEPRFGRDFSDVRIHTGAAASESAGSIHARAYTLGSHVVFRDGEFAPQTTAGRTLLGHELTHVVQQSGSNPLLQRKPESEDTRSITEMAHDFCVAQVGESTAFWEGVHRDYVKPVEVAAGAVVTTGKVVGGAVMSGGMTLLKQILPVLRHPSLWLLPMLKPTADALAGLVWLYDNADWMVTQIKTYVGPLIKLAIDEARSKTALGMGLAAVVAPQRSAAHILGVHRHLDPMLEGLAANWWEILTQAATDLIWPWPTIWKELGTIWDLSKRFANDLCELRLGKLVDHAIGMWRVLNQIAGLLWGYFAIVAAIVGAVIGAGGTPIGSLAGAGVGFSLAVKAGTIILASTVAAEFAAIAKAAYDLSAADEQEETSDLSDDEQAALDEDKETDYKQIAESTLTLTIIGVMFVVGQLASRIISRLRGLFKAKPKTKPLAKPKGKGKGKGQTKGPKKTKKGVAPPKKPKPSSLPRNQKVDPKKVPNHKKLNGTQIAKLQGLPDAPTWPKGLDVPAALKGEPPYVWTKTSTGKLTLARTPAGKKMNMPRVVYDPKRPEQFVNRSAYVKQKTKATVPRELEQGAADARRARGHVEGRQGESEAFASDPDNLLETKSGWAGDEKTIADVTDLQKRVGHTPEPNPALDQGVPGRHHSSHAEKKLATKTGSRRLGVSKEMCLDCQNFFSKLAVHEKRVIVVADPTGLRVFHPNYLTMFLEGASAIPAADIAKQVEEFDADEVDYDEEDEFEGEEESGETEQPTEEDRSGAEPTVK